MIILAVYSYSVNALCQQRRHTSIDITASVISTILNKIIVNQILIEFLVRFKRRTMSEEDQYAYIYLLDHWLLQFLRFLNSSPDKV